MIYSIPEKYNFRLHHIRPRFKNRLESVLIYVASEIARTGEKPREEFISEVNASIRRFPGNAVASDKTINNWRTEISALFGFIQANEAYDKFYPGHRAIELANNQDLIEFFKTFLYMFQYPGGHITPHEAEAMIKAGIKFKPAKFIIQLLMHAEKSESKRIGISRAEFTHMAFNDLRVTRDHEEMSITWNRIMVNRSASAKFDENGDTIRYAGDILDYMVTANLLEKHGNNYYINWLEKEAILKFAKDESWFDKYDSYYGKSFIPIREIRDKSILWFDYVNQVLPKNFFSTDILAFMSSSEEQYTHLRKEFTEIQKQYADEPQPDEISTKRIGDDGENLAYGHECMRIKIGGREDLIHLIKWIPTAFSMGFDIKSVEIDGTQRFVEVKTTISSSELDFKRIHLTTNEWAAAESHGDRYFIYRLVLSRHTRKLFIMQNPVNQYKAGNISMIPRDGADIVFNPSTSGEFTPLLEWKS